MDNEKESYSPHRHASQADAATIESSDHVTVAHTIARAPIRLDFGRITPGCRAGELPGTYLPHSKYLISRRTEHASPSPRTVGSQMAT